MRVAYADPPYLGCGKKLYDRPEWDDVETHAALIQRLRDEYPDGWALSMHTPSIVHLAPFLPREVRWGGWFKPFASFKPNVNPAYCWEPVAFIGGRKRERMEPTVRDFLSCNIALKKGLVGAKPEPFAVWVIELLGLQSTDALDDLFPGTGIISRVWDQYRWHNMPRAAASGAP